MWRFKYQDRVYPINYRRECRIDGKGRPYVEHIIGYEGVTIHERTFDKAVKGLKKIIDDFEGL